MNGQMVPHTSPTDALREYVTPLATTEPTPTDDDLRFLDSTLDGRRVVGLGEATHGSREFFDLKHRLIRYLVERHDFRAVAFEADFSKTRALDAYVAGETGDVSPAGIDLPPDATAADALDQLHIWPWKTESVAELLDWLREFNEDRPPSDRVHIYGIDAQHASGPARAIRELLDRADADPLADWTDTLADLAEEGFTDGPTVIPDHLDDAESLCSAVSTWLDSDAADALSERDRRVLDRHVRTLDRAREHVAARADDAGVATVSRIRDRAMADTVSWILSETGAERVALWAHDGHVQTGRETSYDDPYDVLGTHLRDRLGDDYYALGFDFATGALQAISEVDGEYELGRHEVRDPPEESLTTALGSLDGSVFYLDLDAAADDPSCADWLAESRPKRSLGSTFYGPDDDRENHAEFDFAADFDGLLFVEETTRAEPLFR